MTLAILLFMTAAVAVGAFLIFASMRTTHEDERELARAREREEAARRDAEKARETRAHFEAKLAADVDDARDTIVEMRDPRGIGDGIGLPMTAPAARFRRVDVPAAPFSRL